VVSPPDRDPAIRRALCTTMEHVVYKIGAGCGAYASACASAKLRINLADHIETFNITINSLRAFPTVSQRLRSDPQKTFLLR
jgi:hypothetical protein